jgi:hypothetical protein
MREKIRSAAEEQEPENSLCRVNENQQHAKRENPHAGGNELREQAEVEHTHLGIQDVGQKTASKPIEAVLASRSC